MRHVTLAFRTLFKTPFVTGIAVISLALGIGANAAIFSLFDQILLRPLPVPEPDRLVNLAAPGPKPGSQSCGQAGDCDVVFSYPMFRDLERSQTVFTGLAAHCVFGVSLSYRDQPTTGEGMYVSGSYFPTLGLRPALGRLLAPRSEEHTSELQSQSNLVCRLLLEKKKNSCIALPLSPRMLHTISAFSIATTLTTTTYRLSCPSFLAFC